MKISLMIIRNNLFVKGQRKIIRGESGTCRETQMQMLMCVVSFQHTQTNDSEFTFGQIMLHIIPMACK